MLAGYQLRQITGPNVNDERTPHLVGQRSNIHAQGSVTLVADLYDEQGRFLLTTAGESTLEALGPRIEAWLNRLAALQV